MAAGQAGLQLAGMCCRGLAQLEELVRKLDDMLANRVEANMAATSRMSLVDLPADRSRHRRRVCGPAGPSTRAPRASAWPSGVPALLTRALPTAASCRPAYCTRSSAGALLGARLPAGACA